LFDNVKKLVEVADIDFTKAVKFAANMTLISAGLIIFGVGAAVGGLGSALANFTDPTWAKLIVDNVKTLVTVGDIDFKKVVDFAANMGFISAGLVAFGIGSTVAGVGQAIAKFTGGSDWSQTTVDNVKKSFNYPHLYLEQLLQK
jgi:tetrahydromethanopterin S-methyltransferase subunit C